MAIGLVVAIRIDFRLADELTVFGGEGHDVVEDQETNWLASESPADVEVTKLAQVAQRDVTAHVNGVGADAPMGPVDERLGFGSGARVMGHAGRASTHPAVRANVVVVDNDVIKDVLEFAQRLRGPLQKVPHTHRPSSPPRFR